MINEEHKPCPLLSTLTCCVYIQSQPVLSHTALYLIFLPLSFISTSLVTTTIISMMYIMVSLGGPYPMLVQSFYLSQERHLLWSSLFTFTAYEINVPGTFYPTLWNKSLKKGLSGLASVICPHNRTSSLNDMTHPCGEEAGGLCGLKV